MGCLQCGKQTKFKKRQDVHRKFCDDVCSYRQYDDIPQKQRGKI